MERRRIGFVVPLTLLALACPGSRLDLDDKGTEAPPTVTIDELAALEVGQPEFCANGEASVEFTEPGERFAFAFDLRAGEAIRLETVGDDSLDTVVHLFGPDSTGLPVATDDDSGPGRLSLLEATAKTDGRHTALLTTFRGQGRGPVALRIRVGDVPGCRSAPPVATADLQGPAELDLGQVATGGMATFTLTLTNPGGADAVISQVTFEPAGAAGFGIDWPCGRTDGSAGGFLAIGNTAGDTTSACAGPVTVPAGGSLDVPVRYEPQAEGSASARLTFRWNGGEDRVVTLFANRQGPCLQAIPGTLDFGFAKVGTARGIEMMIRNCSLGSETRITGLALEDPAETRFTVNMVGPVSAADPGVLGPGESLVVTIVFVADGPAPGPYRNALRVDSDAPSSPLRIEMVGWSGEAMVPVCDFVLLADGAEVADGGVVPLLAALHLVDRSYAVSPGDTIDERAWTVLAQPDGSVQVFAPSPVSTDVQYTPVVPGRHVFGLEVGSAAGMPASCQRTIDVAGPAGWLIELTWRTPGDSDPSDACPPTVSCGSDLDLHFVHPHATGETVDPITGEPYGYFDEGWDTYWMNAHPVWDPANLDPQHQPRLDRDDTDGSGPEILVFDIPEADRCYRVGVHSFDDHGFGISYPTVRFWDANALVHEVTLAGGLRMGEMWDVGKVCGRLAGDAFVRHSTASGDPVVIPAYPAAP